ncbi:MAG: PIN domain-containing protein [Burkholderiales bacterium]
MSEADVFFDTNIVLYLLSADPVKADRAEELLSIGGMISVQVLNEFTSVALKKLRMTWPEIREILAQVRAVCPVANLTLATHDRAAQVAERYGVSFYDALIVAAALIAGCTTLFSEDLQDGQVIERQLTICNPFKDAVG